MVVTDREALQPARVGLEIAAALWRLHGEQFDKQTSERLLGSRADFARAKAGEDPAAIAAGWAAAEAGWRRLRAKYLLYPVGRSFSSAEWRPRRRPTGCCGRAPAPATAAAGR